jgi:pyruvate dehydrogenase E2 component (dihydrolipoamide acetyltransferase)
MEVELKAPAAGPTGEITIVEWKKKEGEKVQKGDVIATGNSVKISTEIKAPASGTIKSILVKAGSKVKAGTTIAIIES